MKHDADFGKQRAEVKIREMHLFSLANRSCPWLGDAQAITQQTRHQHRREGKLMVEH